MRLRALLLDALRNGPDLLSERLTLLVVRIHRPHEIDGRAYCTAHGWGRPVEWPCEDELQALDRLDRIRQRLRPPATG